MILPPLDEDRDLLGPKDAVLGSRRVVQPHDGLRVPEQRRLLVLQGGRVPEDPEAPAVGPPGELVHEGHGTGDTVQGEEDVEGVEDDQGLAVLSVGGVHSDSDLSGISRNIPRKI